MSTFGDRLKEERERLGFNQTDFGALGGVKKQAQLNYEKGERNPDSAYISAIANHGVDILYLVTGTRTKVHLALAAVKTATEAGMAVEAITGNREDALAAQESIVSQSILKPDEAALLDNYRNSLPEGKRAISTTSAAFAQQATTQKVSGDE